VHYEDARLQITKVVVGPLHTNVWVLRCRRSGQSVLLDAADKAATLLELCADLDVKEVLETHGHRDHIQAVPQLRAAGYRVGVSPWDSTMLSGYDFLIEDDSAIAVGDLTLRAIHTPGHTPGSLCFAVEGASLLFSGDTLFPGGPGATSSKAAFSLIIDSIRDRLFSELPDETLVMPGHGLDTTIGAERSHLQEWIDRGW